MLQIRLLGDFRIDNGDEPISLKAPRLQALLAYLLLHRDAPQSRQHIAFLFWPDSAEDQAQTNLRKLIVSLRFAFPALDRYIAVDRRTLQWRNSLAYSLDVSDFERALGHLDKPDSSRSTIERSLPEQISRLRRTVDLYTGDLLPGCYDEWIAAPRERLRQGFLETLQELVHALQDSGEPGLAILYARRLLRHDPLQEGNYRQLMQLYLANGERTAAIAVYRQCESFLKRELGIEPSPVTVEIARHIDDLLASEAGKARQRSRKPGAKSHRVESQEAGGNEVWVTSASVSNNLPAATTLFIGREREVSVVSEMLCRDAVRLVTLTGTAGSGKTRLALQVASSLVDLGAGIPPDAHHPFPDGVLFVPLASVDDADLIPSVLAHALGIAESGYRPIIDGLLAHLRDKDLLLVLDNFEHLLQGASLVAAMLAACPRLKVLVTSRAILSISEEHEYALSPMQVPGKDLLAAVALMPEDLAQYDAIALFVERAMEVFPGFALSRSNARSVAELCRRLEGLPLAIELAAARVRALSPDAILSRLDRRLKLLVGGKRDLPLRQQTLEAAIAWSYNLLNPEEQALFRKLAIFSGGFTLEAVEGVTGGAGLLDIVSALIGKSLLLRLDADLPEEPRRFTMLETIREYALDRLREHGEEEALESKHALYFMALAEVSVGELNGPRQHEWIGKLDHEHDNLRAALNWSITRNNADVALRLSSSLGLFWERRGYLSEGRRWIRRALGLQSDLNSRYRADALHYGGLLASRQRDYTEAQYLLQQSRLAFRELGDKAGESNALSALAIMTSDRDLETAIHLHLQSLQLRRELGDKVGIARTLQNLGYIKMNQDKWDEASSLSGEALLLYRELESQQGIAYTLYVLARVAAKQGEHKLARERFDECLEISRELWNNWLTAWALGGLGDLHYRTGQYDDANRSFARAWDLFTELGDKLGMTHTLVARAREAQRLHDYDRADQIYRDAIALGRELENNGVVGSCIAGLAGLASAAGRYRDAAVLFGSAERLLNEFLTGIEREQMTLGLAEARSALGDDAWQASWAEGEAMTTQEALALASPLG